MGRCHGGVRTTAAVTAHLAAPGHALFIQASHASSLLASRRRTISMPGCTSRALASTLRIEGHVGKQVNLGEDERSDLKKMDGYLSGLSSPSSRSAHNLRCLAQIVARRAHKIADVFDEQQIDLIQVHAARCFSIMRASRWQVPPVVICRTGKPYCASRRASLSVCMSPSARTPASLDRSRPACAPAVLSCPTRSADQVQAKHAVRAEPFPKRFGDNLVLTQHL